MSTIRLSDFNDRCVDFDLKLTKKEASRLTELAESKGMSENQLLVQALRMYDAVDSGDAELIFKPDPNFYRGLKDE